MNYSVLLHTSVLLRRPLPILSSNMRSRNELVGVASRRGLLKFAICTRIKSSRYMYMYLFFMIPRDLICACARGDVCLDFDGVPSLRILRSALVQ